MHKLRKLILIAVIALAGLSACYSLGLNPAPAPTRVTVQLKWTHQAQFAGFYAADQQGYYAEEGLAVAFIEGGAGIDMQAAVTSGAAQFGVADAAQLIMTRAAGMPLRAIGVIYRRSPLVLISLAQAGITRPQDIAGKTVRVTSESVPAFHAMMSRAGVKPDQYTNTNVPNDLAVFASGNPAVWGVYVNGYSLTVEQAGYQINKIYPDDYGVHFYADTLFTRDDLIASDPDLVLRFLRATLKGWTYAVENPSEIGALVARYNPAADVGLENAKMLASLPLVNTGEDHIGWMKPALWSDMEQILRQQGVLTRTLDLAQVYTLQFLDEVYAQP